MTTVNSLRDNVTDVATDEPLTLPVDMTFNDESLVAVIVYSVLFIVSATGNLSVLFALCSAGKQRRRESVSRGRPVRRQPAGRRGFSLLIMHLCIADLLITFVFIPLELGWHVTVAWMAGDAACRVLNFARAFGFYLSSFVLVAIAVDRYLSLDLSYSQARADRRACSMLIIAWTCSTVASTPQVGCNVNCTAV